LASTDILTTYEGDGSIIEDLIPRIENVDPVDAPLLMMSARVPARDRTHIWQTDTLEAAQLKAATEGVRVTDGNLGVPTQVSNTTHIIREEFTVSDTQMAVTHVGFANAFAYQMLKGSKQVTRNTEFALIQSTRS
jgi:hypothetical protein